MGVYYHLSLVLAQQILVCSKRQCVEPNELKLYRNEELTEASASTGIGIRDTNQAERLAVDWTSRTLSLVTNVVLVFIYYYL